MHPSPSPGQLASVRRAAAELNSLRPATDAVNRIFADHAVALDAAIGLGERRIRAQLSDAGEEISRVLAAADLGWRDQVAEAVRALGQLAQERTRVLDSISQVDVSALNRLLNDLNTWRALTSEQRARALDAAQTAYAAAASEPADDVLPDDLAAAVRDIAATDAVYLPIALSRQTFVVFVGSVVLLYLMTLSFSNETAGEVLIKGAELSVFAAFAMRAAGALWDRCNSEQGNDQSDSSGT
jgi:hypothetical protein